MAWHSGNALNSNSEGVPIRILVRISATLTHVSCGFPQSLKMQGQSLYPGHDCFLQNPFKFIIILTLNMALHFGIFFKGFPKS
jgi:hypothetical protein